MANALIPQKTLRIGVSEALYVATAGAFNTTGTAGTAPVGTFGLPPQCSNYRGSLVLQFIPVGTLTAATFQLETSLDNVNWGILSREANYSAATTALSAFSGIALGTASTFPVIAFDLSGLGGIGTMRLNFTTFTLNAGTGLNVFAHIG